MVLALATFLVAFAALLCVPIITNYAVESFPSHAFEASIAMGTYRLVFGLAIPFFVHPWEREVKTGWVFGMAAFFSLVAFLLVLSLMVKGSKIHSCNISLPSNDSKASGDEEVEFEN